MIDAWLDAPVVAKFDAPKDDNYFHNFATSFTTNTGATLP
jgi:hypothetical protein